MRQPLPQQFDDAIHLRDAMEHYTLCDQPVAGLNVRWSGDPFPDAGSGCWTCLKVATERHGAVTSTGKEQS